MDDCSSVCCLWSILKLSRLLKLCTELSLLLVFHIAYIINILQGQSRRGQCNRGIWEVPLPFSLRCCPVMGGVVWWFESPGSLCCVWTRTTWMKCWFIAGSPQTFKQFASIHLYSWVERSTVRVKCLAQRHNDPGQRSNQDYFIRSATRQPLDHRATETRECAIHSLDRDHTSCNRPFYKMAAANSY